MQIETYRVPYKRIISCGRLDTKFGLVTCIPERHAYFKTTKQARKKAWGGGANKRKNLKLLSYKHLSTWTNSCGSQWEKKYLLFFGVTSGSLSYSLEVDVALQPLRNALWLKTGSLKSFSGL